MFERIITNFHRFFGNYEAIEDNINITNEENDKLLSDEIVENGHFRISTLEELLNEKFGEHEICDDNDHINDLDIIQRADAEAEFAIDAPSVKEENNTTAEKSDLYEGKLFDIDDTWRLIVCDAGIQWILQKRKGSYNGRPAWVGVSYCRSKAGLLRVISEKVGEVSPAVEARLALLPEWVES